MLTSSSSSSDGPDWRPSSGRSSQSISTTPTRPPAVAAGPAADPRALERDQRGVAEPGVGAAREDLRDLRGRRRLDHVVGVAGVGDPQGDPQVGVGLDLRADHAGGALRRQDEVDAERTASAGHVDEPGHEVGQLGGQRRELVDHDQQPRHRLVAGHPRRRVVLDVLGVRVRQLVLATMQLGAERLERAGGQVAVEVGDHADGVRQVVAVLEGRAALVVDQHEVELVRPVADRERGDHRLQELGLAGARRTRDQAVRSVRPDVDAEDRRRWTHRSRPVVRPLPAQPRMTAPAEGVVQPSTSAAGSRRAATRRGPRSRRP